MEFLGYLLAGFWKGWLFLCIWIWIFGVYLMSVVFYLGLWVVVLGWWCGWGLVVEIGFVDRNALQRCPLVGIKKASW